MGLQIKNSILTGITLIQGNTTLDAFVVSQANAAGFAAVAFKDSAGVNRYAQGYGNSGTASPFTSSAYHVSVGSGGSNVPIKFLQYDGTTTGAVLVLDSNRKITLGILGIATKFVRHGAVNLVAGSATVSDTNVGANTRIFVQRQTDGGTIGCSYSVSRSNGASFSIVSKTSAGADQTADTSSMAYLLIEP